MTTQAYPLRISKEMMEVARLRAQHHHIDQSAALRQLLYLGAEEYILGLIEEGRVSVSRAAEMLDISPLDIYHAAKKHNIRLGSTTEQWEMSSAAAASFFNSKKKSQKPAKRKGSV